MRTVRPVAAEKCYAVHNAKVTPTKLLDLPGDQYYLLRPEDPRGVAVVVCTNNLSIQTYVYRRGKWKRFQIHLVFDADADTPNTLE